MLIRSLARRFAIAAAFLLGMNGTVFAAPVVYSIDVDTSAVAGTSGSIEFQLNPGGSGALPASGEISAFAGGTLVFGKFSPDYFGNASGTLSPGLATLDNGMPLNLILHNFDYDGGFSFLLTVAGPALDTPDPLLPGTRFSIFLWDKQDGFGNPLFPIDGFTDAALTIDINPDGSITIANAPQVPVTAVNLVAAPEPATWFLLTASLLGCLVVYRRGAW